MFSIHRQTFDRWVQYRKLPLIRIGMCIPAKLTPHSGKLTPIV